MIHLSKAANLSHDWEPALWSHFKNAVRGTHIHISGKHLWKYRCGVQLPPQFPRLSLRNVYSSCFRFRAATPSRRL